MQALAPFFGSLKALDLKTQRKKVVCRLWQPPWYTPIKSAFWKMLCHKDYNGMVFLQYESLYVGTMIVLEKMLYDKNNIWMFFLLCGFVYDLLKLH